jgi:hypothetical protein
MKRFRLALVALVSGAMAGCMTVAFGTHAPVDIELAQPDATARVFEAQRREMEPWREPSGDLIARRWRLEPIHFIEEVRGKGTIRLRRGPTYLIVVDHGYDANPTLSGLRSERAVCPELDDRWWLATVVGLGVGGVIDWATGAIWQYANQKIYREDAWRGAAFCYRRLPLAVSLDHLLADEDQ